MRARQQMYKCDVVHEGDSHVGLHYLAPGNRLVLLKVMQGGLRSGETKNAALRGGRAYLSNHELHKFVGVC